MDWYKKISLFGFNKENTVISHTHFLFSLVFYFMQTYSGVDCQQTMAVS